MTTKPSAHDSGTLLRFLRWARETFGSTWNVDADYTAMRYLASIPDHARISVASSGEDLTISWHIIDGTGRGSARFVRTSPELRIALRRYTDAITEAWGSSTSEPESPVTNRGTNPPDETL